MIRKELFIRHTMNVAAVCGLLSGETGGHEHEGIGEKPR